MTAQLSFWGQVAKAYAQPVSSRENAQRAGEKTKQNLDSDPKKLARANDPGTSKAAAKTVKQFSKKRHALILWGLGIREGTFYDIAETTGLEPSQVWRRLNELERKGLIEPTGGERRGPTGRMCRVWRLL